MKVTALIFVATCLAVSTEAGAVVEKPTIRVLITPECKSMFYGHAFVEAHGRPDLRKLPSYVPWDPTAAKPMVYKDPRTSISFYVESDGRHLAAIDVDGKLLWVRNPFEEAKFCPYRTPRPVFSSIVATDLSDQEATVLAKFGANTADNFISINFNSSQFGVVDETTGDFFPEGQN